MTTRLAVIGAGVMGSDHARIVAEELPGTTLQVVCDIDARRARHVAEALGAAHSATDPEMTITRNDVDAVIVASPDFTHASLCKACIAAGKRVLCEKPLSQSSTECLEVMEAEQTAGNKFVQLGFMRRYDRSYVEMKRAVTDGTLGRALMMHNFHRNVKTPASDFTGAMAITNSAPHEFDAGCYVLGSEYRAISAYQPKRTDALVAPVLMVLETTNDQLVNIEVNNNAAYGYDVRAELVGEKGAVSMNNVACIRSDMELASRTAYEVDWRRRFAEAYRQQNCDFVRFVETGLFPATAASSWDGYCAAKVAEAGVAALDEKRRIAVDLIDRPAFYE